MGCISEIRDNPNSYDDSTSSSAAPPCQDLSIAGKRAGLVEGKRSSLFFEYVRILKEVKPKFFLVENVASMPKEAKEEITRNLFGIEPVMINAALVSAQSRKRLYWVGKRNDDGTYSRVEITQPEDRGIVLRDVLEDIPFDARNAKGEPLWKPVPEKYLATIAEKIEKFSLDRKALTVPAKYAKVGIADKLKSEREIIIATIPHGHFEGRVSDEKVLALTKSDWEGNNKLVAQFRRTDLRIHAEQEKVCTLTANMGTG